ncbi:hypothetical protein TKK_0011426 [Trichogramma kaykai]|uniref:Secreted protein n=1 Tax=Trichogramma kaykai TaxID=54128 RepID=A0ABD2WTQ9_9HYME
MFSRYFLSFLSVLVFAAVISASAIHEPRFFDDDNSDELVDSIGLPDVSSELEDLIDVLGGDRHRPPPPLIGKIIAAIKNALRWLRRHCIRDAVLECKQHVPHIKPWLKCLKESIVAHKGNCTRPPHPTSTVSPSTEPAEPEPEPTEPVNGTVLLF